MNGESNQPTTSETRTAASEEMADLSYPDHILALPNDIVDRLPLLSKPSSVLVREGARYNNHNFGMLLDNLEAVDQSWTILQQVSTDRLSKISGTAFDGNPEAIKQFEKGVRDASTKVKKAVKDIRRVKFSAQMTIFVVITEGMKQGWKPRVSAS
ncbi:MAG: hypothetical protein Q9199_007787 [Rusavskia elegans]